MDVNVATWSAHVRFIHAAPANDLWRHGIVSSSPGNHPGSVNVAGNWAKSRAEKNVYSIIKKENFTGKTIKNMLYIDQTNQLIRHKQYIKKAYYF